MIAREGRKEKLKGIFKNMLNKLKTIFSLLKSGRFDLFFYKAAKKIGIKDILPPLPIWLVIEPCNFCNLKCPVCLTGSGKMNRPSKAMGFEEFKKIVDQVRGYTKKILLFGWGEPFLNKDILKMVKYAVESGIRDVRLSTNCTLLNSKELCEEIVKSGLRRLILSFDGLDQETLSKYRRGANFNNIVEGIKLFTRTKKELGADLPETELQFLVMKHNEHQRKAMREFARKLGVDVYMEKSLNTYRGSYFQEKAKDFLPKDQSRSRYILEDNKKYKLKGEIPNSCHLVYQSAVINSDGTVIPCCNDLYSDYIMGNVFKEKLKNIWKNKKYQTLRKKIRKNRKGILMCRTCPVDREVFLTEKNKMK